MAAPPRAAADFGVVQARRPPGRPRPPNPGHAQPPPRADRTGASTRPPAGRRHLVPAPGAYDSTPPRGSRPDHSRVYLPGGREADLAEAVCWTGCGGRAASRRDRWHGTGSQEEYETAKRLPLCRACFGWRETGQR